jgi:two-component system OmpR family response regulator
MIDDDEAFTALVADYVSAEGISCRREAASPRGLGLALVGNYDVVVLDVMMPELDGVELLRRLRRESDVPVLMLTARGDSLDRSIGLELGADDYMPKPCYPRELVARLRAIVRRTRGETGLAKRAQADLAVGALTISPARREATLGAAQLELTASEFDLLTALASAPGEVMTKDELSRKALGRAREPYDRSVDVHVSNLRQKLAQAGSQMTEIETVRGVGYRLRTPQ